MDKEIMTYGDLKAVVIGASGAVGRVIVDYLVNSGKWSKVVIITRRKLKQWDSFPMTKCEIKMVIVENLDILGESKEEMLKKNENLNFEGFNSVFNCLGSRVGRGKEEFKKVDYTYVVYSASLCEKFNIPHFSHVSSSGSNSNSCFYYMKIKGEIEEKLKTMNIQHLSVFKPGAILDRDNDFRCGECFLKVVIFLTCCCLPHIKSVDLGNAVAFEAEKKSESIVDKSKYFYSNSEIVTLSKEQKKIKN